MKIHRFNHIKRGRRSLLLSSYWTRVVAGFAAVVIFCTTYWLMLPAVALTGNEATSESGIFLDASEDTTEVAGDSEQTVTEEEITESAVETAAAEDNGEDKLTEASGSWEQIPETESPAVSEETTPGGGEGEPADSGSAVSAAASSEIPQTSVEETNSGTVAASDTTGISGGSSSEPEEVVATEESTSTSADTGTEESLSEETVSEESSVDSEELSAEVEEQEETEEEEEVFGSGKLLFRGNNYSVTIEYGEDARIPDTAELRVRELEADSEEYQVHYETAKSNAKENGAQVRTARFFDITIVAPEKNADAADAADEETWREIEPAAPVKVNIVFDKEELELPENAEVEVLHFADENNAEAVEKEKVEVETSENSEGTAVSGIGFDVDAFSVFGVVGTEMIVIDYLTDKGSTYEITVDLSNVTNVPNDAYLDIRELSGDAYDQYLTATAEALGTDVYNIAKVKLFDITIKSGDDEIEPNGKVSVDIKLKKEVFGDAAVVHFGEETEVLDVTTDGNVVSFETETFSVYAIIPYDGIPQPPRVTFEFSDPNTPDFTFIDKAGHPQTTQIIKDGDVLQDVGLPTIPEGEAFSGWFVYDDETAVEMISFGAPISVTYGTAGAGSSISASSITIDPDDLNEDGTYHVQVKAFFGDVVYVTYYEDAAGTNILTKKQIPKGASYNINSQLVNAPNSELAFRGWATTAGSNDDSREPVSFIEDTNNPPVYNVTVDEDTYYYPVFKSGHWITFYSGATGSGADYRAPAFVAAGGTAASARPSNPEWKGYAFQYWTEDNLYTGENGSYVQPSAAPTRFDFNSQIDEAKTLYAYWTPADTTYTVVFWRQNVTDDKNAESKTYTFAGQETKEGTTGTTVEAEDYERYRSEDGTIDFSECYDLNAEKSDESVTVNADGTSVINVYFDRQVITMRFYQNGNDYDGPDGDYNWDGWTGTNHVTTYTGLYGQTLEQNGYSWPAGLWWYYNNEGGRTGMTFLGQFVLPDGVYDESGREIRLYFGGTENTSDIEFYLQNTDGSTYNEEQDDTGTGTSASRFYFSEKYDGFEVKEYRRYYLDNSGNKVYIDQNGTVQSNPENAWANAAVGGSTPLSLTVNTGNPNDYVYYYGGGDDTVIYTDTRYAGTQNYTYQNLNTRNDLIWTYNGEGSFSASYAGQDWYGNRYYYFLQNPRVTTGNTGTQYGVVYFAGGRSGYIQLSRQQGYRSVNCVLEVRYERKHYNLKYLDSVDNTELQGISTQDVVYGASLSEYEPTSTFIPVSQYPGKVWDGKWYKDQACTDEFDWSVTMPNDNMVVYAGWKDVYYKVDIDPNGGTLTEGESTLFWRTYGQTIQRYDDVVRDYAEDPDGDYKYEDFLRSKYEAAGYDPWDYDGYLRTARYVTSDTTTTVPMIPQDPSQDAGSFIYPYESTRYSYEKGAYALIGWYELTFEEGHYGELDHVTGESLYTFGTQVTHDTYIQAKWRRVGEYHVEYKPDVYLMDADGNITASDSGIDTTNVPSDGNSYADQSESAIMRSPDSPITRTVGEGDEAESKQFVFQGWYYNGQLYTPGEIFTVLSSLAEDKVIGQDETTGEDIIQKTVYLYPVYQSVDDLPVDVTHIYWYSNWQDKDGNIIEGRTEANQYKNEISNELQPNEAVDIESIDNLLNGSTAYQGYTFLGWAKSPTANTPWLTYNKNTGKYTVVKDGTTYDNVTQVAADETQPYDDLYAIWEINKYTVTVTKTVAGGGDQHKGFIFAPEFTKYSGASNFILAGEETTITDDSGTSHTYYSSKEFIEVPYGATLKLTENSYSEYDTSVKYMVTSNVDGSAIENPQEIDSTNGATYTIQGDITIEYTNTLKTTTVTVKKSLTNPYIDGEAGQNFSFTATYAGGEPLSFIVNSNSVDGYKIENVPVGVQMIITETADDAYEYAVSAEGTVTSDSDSIDNTYTFTVPVDAETVTFTNALVKAGINVVKTDDQTPAKGLKGATFELTRNTKLDGTGTYAAVEGLFSEGITSGDNGEMIVSSAEFPTGYYQLKEIQAPDGYIITNNTVTFQVVLTENEDDEEVASITLVSGDNASVSDDGKTLTITNKAGQALPSTGGPGTRIFTILGGMLIALAGVLLLQRRRLL